MKCVMQSRDCFGRITAPSHADFIQAVTLRVIADRQRERQRVFDDHRISADVGLAADGAKLMNAGIGADVCAIFDNHVPGEGRRVGHDDVVTNQTIMGDVRLGHYEAVIANFREATAAFSAAMNRYTFANARAAASLSVSLFAREFQVLRRQADRYEWKQMRFIADTRAAVNHTMRVNGDAVSEKDFIPDHGVGTDRATFADECARADYGRRMNLIGSILN